MLIRGIKECDIVMWTLLGYRRLAFSNTPEVKNMIT